VSKWTWPFCKQFTTVVHDPTLLIPNGAPLLPASAVFAQLAINHKLLLNPPKGKFAFDHCNIEKVMQQLGYTKSSPYYYDVLKANRRMVEKLANARRTRYEKTIDLCAHVFLQLCGFDDTPFSIDVAGSDFTIFGKTCYSDGDYYAVVTENKDLVLVFEDKSLSEGKVIEKQGHLGQIVGELLQMLSLNRDKNLFRDVFAVRFVNYHATAFRIVPCQTTLNTLCVTTQVPKTKLQLLCTEANPDKNLGPSLIDKAQRLKVLQIMADIRQFIGKV